MRKIWVLLIIAFFGMHFSHAQSLLKKIPDKLVVLTFDDAVLSHYTFVAPLLKKYKFGATFFVCEFSDPPFADKIKYMSWEQISKLDKMGFEIGNHTQHHTHVNKLDPQHFEDELTYIETKSKQYKINKPLVSFAYPGYDVAASAIPILKDKDYLFARAGGNRPYNPEKDHPYLIPSYTTYANNKAQIMDALQQAKDGKIVVLTIHGVPDDAHPWVTTPPELFEEYLKYLQDHQYKVLALRDLANFINVKEASEKIQPDYASVMNK
ncbi:polysaccharide deacetylase family protein [Mucilaginibacter arboris]|uniref:Polysaccharide deacetylase family protein n=1 Tax=Mucilaginibacter arboris TaxID=2682090 RepID=A0A7K1SZI6_9SPHI|nr:polysaccharide deacetylase family protein [Mucilaginibacter arboris]MVN22713.1 polysaccharide deacetylase family protein [Mucilaginibacter arboris]